MYIVTCRSSSEQHGNSYVNEFPTFDEAVTWATERFEKTQYTYLIARVEARVVAQPLVLREPVEQQGALL